MAGSSGRAPIIGSGPPAIARHSSSSAARSGRWAASTSPWAHLRIDVPTGARSGGSPDSIRAHTTARSATRTRQEAVSITERCTRIRIRPGSAVFSGSNQTTCSTIPASGSSRSAAEVDSATTVRNSVLGGIARIGTRWMTSSARIVPTGSTSHARRPSSSDSRARSMSCRSRTTCTVSTSRCRSIPIGRFSSIACERRPNWDPDRSSSRRMIGVSGTGPTPAPGSSVARVAVPSRAATWASPATVFCSNTSRAENPTPAALARVTNWIDMMLSPPRAKKESSRPTVSAPSRSAKASAMMCSVGVCGAR